MQSAMVRSALFLLIAVAVAMPATAEEPVKKSQWQVLRAAFLDSPPNIPAPTLGGTQFWGDELYYGQWRIQHNVVTDHYRLLAPNDVREAWGDRPTCERRLEELKRTRQLQPLRGKLVIVLHGLMGSRLMMKSLVESLEAADEYQVLSITYPSTRAGVAEHAAALAGIIDGLDQVTEINFVAHSLGNLVIRRYLHDYAEAHEGAIDPRIKRCVMIGPPNHGSRCAVMLGGNIIYDGTLGDSAAQLGRRWQELAPTLATPACEFGILAGGVGNAFGFSPLLDGDDDGTVRVAEARLSGANDFSLITNHHALLTVTPSVHEQTLRYLRTGCFREDGVRHPIERDDAEPPVREEANAE